MSNEFQKLTIKDSFMFAVENGTQRHFNVEMQVERPKSLSRRTRYYHSQMDDEDGRVLDDGHITILLSTKGENDPEISSALRHFLKYVENPNHPSKDTANDSYVRSLSAQIAAIKRSRSYGIDSLM